MGAYVTSLCCFLCPCVSSDNGIQFKLWLKSPSGKRVMSLMWWFVLFWVIQVLIIECVSLIWVLKHPFDTNNWARSCGYGVIVGVYFFLAYWITSAKLHGKSSQTPPVLVYAPKHIFVIDADIKKVQAMKCIAAAEGNTQEKAENLLKDIAEIV